MATTNSKVVLLPVISSRQAALNAKKEIDEGMSDEQVVLLCRWLKVNTALLGGWRFAFTYIIAGLSGAGKSFFLNMIRKDFTNKLLNGHYKRKFRQLHIAFEMTAADEVLRDVSGHVKTSYGEIISAYKSVNGRKLSPEKYAEIMEYLKMIAELDIDYVEVTGTVDQVEATIMAWDAKYPDEQKIISLDHTLLTDFDKEADEIALISNLSKMFLRVKKRIGSMNIIVAQLNGDIESESRIARPSGHFPIGKDLYGSKSIRRDADAIMVLNAPEKLGIAQYGIQKHDTKGIIFWHLIKMRKATTGYIRFQDDLKNGNLIELETSN